MSPKLGDYCSVIMGQAPPGDTYSATEGTPLIAGAGDFSKGQLRPKKFTSKPSRLSKAGDIVLSIRASIGDKVWADGEYCLGRGVAALRPSADLDRSFLWHWLNHAEPSLQAKAKGATFLQVNRSDIADLPIALPPLDEQRRIAAILDKTDELRTKRREALAHLDTLTHSIFHSMFEEVEFPVAPLGSVARFFGGNSLPQGHSFENQRTGYLLLKVSDMNRSGNERRLVTAGAWSETPGSKASTCPAGCVVLPKRGASISTNKKRLTVRASVLDPNLMAVEPSPALDPAYLFAWFDNFDLTAITSGSSVPQLNKQDLHPLPISVPPLELQQTFATRVAAVERLKEAHRKHLAELDALFASLQHRAFKGEL
ncbi:restriction endonuclease subunit S [Pseudarthrobacter oxydans]|uniref:restriction endonuclease subunit S n=1 Tax=Pseudarthrobacter oxydans TaxID=1671 RepID=UPI00344A6313